MIAATARGSTRPTDEKGPEILDDCSTSRRDLGRATSIDLPRFDLAAVRDSHDSAHTDDLHGVVQDRLRDLQERLLLEHASASTTHRNRCLATLAPAFCASALPPFSLSMTTTAESSRETYAWRTGAWGGWLASRDEPARARTPLAGALGSRRCTPPRRRSPRASGTEGRNEADGFHDAGLLVVGGNDHTDARPEVAKQKSPRSPSTWRRNLWPIACEAEIVNAR